MDKRWLEFEKAVARFVSAIDPSARVTHDAHLPDRDTGTPRQRDIWVEGRLCGLFPIKVLISCKRYSRKINQTDIDHFWGELLSATAQKGVMYSFSKFNEHAIEKARKLGISCFYLLENQPPEIPEHIMFSATYCLYQNTEFRMLELVDPKSRIKTWSDIFEIVDFEVQQNKRVPLLDFYSSMVKKSVEKAKGELKNGFPSGYRSEITIQPDDYPELSFRTRTTINWVIFKGKLEAHMVDGSYSVTEKEFVGSISSPSIGFRGETPGPGWEQITNIDNEVSSFSVKFILQAVDIAAYIKSNFYHQPVVVHPEVGTAVQH